MQLVADKFAGETTLFQDDCLLGKILPCFGLHQTRREFRSCGDGHALDGEGDSAGYSMATLWICPAVPECCWSIRCVRGRTSVFLQGWPIVKTSCVQLREQKPERTALLSLQTVCYISARYFWWQSGCRCSKYLHGSVTKETEVSCYNICASVVSRDSVCGLKFKARNFCRNHTVHACETDFTQLVSCVYDSTNDSWASIQKREVQNYGKVSWFE
jgi:hypothetical protein